MGDKKDYLGKYKYNSSNYITISDSTARFVLNGESTKYNYSYVNYTWKKKYCSDYSNGNEALILYEDVSSSKYILLEFTDSGDLLYAKQYTFSYVS